MRKLLLCILSTLMFLTLGATNIIAENEGLDFSMFPDSNTCLNMPKGPDFVFNLTGYTISSAGDIQVISTNDSQDYADEDHFVVDYINNNKFKVYAENNVVSGIYYIQVKGQTEKCYINVIGESIQKCLFEYNDVQYQVGPANGSTDNKTLHIESDGRIDAYGEHRGWGFFLGVGKYENGDVTGSAPQEVIDMVLANLTVTFKGDDILEFDNRQEEQPTDYHFNDKTVTDGVDTKDYQIKLKEGKDSGDASVLIEFEVEGQDYSLEVPIVISHEVTAVFGTNDLTSVEGGETVIDKLNIVFKTKSALNQLYKAKTGSDITDDSNIYFELDENTTYNGIIEFNCKNPDDHFNLCLRTKNYDESNSDELFNSNNKLYTYPSVNNNATIIGGIWNKSGLNKIEGIDFVGSDSFKISYNDGTNQTNKIGLYVNGGEEPEGIYANSISEIYNCKFSDYDYAVLSTGKGMISGETGCLFEGNTNAIFIDSTFNDRYSDTLKTTFVDNDTAITIKRLPASINPLQFVISNNYFFENDIDFNIGDDIKGTYFFIENYYGESYVDGFSSDNNAPAKNTYNARNDFTLVSNPCIRYPEDLNCIMGIDDSSVTKFKNGQGYTLHTNDIKNSENELEIGVYDSDSDSDSGRLLFGGNQ